MSNVYYPSPGTTINGIKDVYTSAVTPTTEPKAFSNSFLFTFSKKGPVDTPIWATGLKLQNVYGEEVVTTPTIYTTHQTPFLQYNNKKSAPSCVVRVAPDDIGPKPNLSIWVEVIESANVKTYKRDDITGKYVYDSVTNEKIPLGTTSGIKLRFFTKVVTGEINGLTSTIGTYTEDGETSTCLPLYAFEHSFFGEDGNNAGLRMYPALLEDSPDVTAAEMKSTGFPMRISVVRKSATSTSGSIVSTQAGSKYIEGSIISEMLHPTTSKAYDLFSFLTSKYSNTSADNLVYSDVGVIYKYEAYVEKLHQMLADVLGVDEIYTVNPWTGVDFNGLPYDGYEELPPLNNSFIFSSKVTGFFEGGSDGTMNNETFDKAVRTYLDNVTAWDEYKITDLGAYPIKSMVDSGFTLEGKKSMIRFGLGIHKALTLFACTQDVLRENNSEEYDLSMLQVLNSYAASFPESVVFNTETLRMCILGRMAWYSSTDYDKAIPLIYSAWTRYIDQFGASSGNINAEKTMSSDEQRTLSDIIKMSYDYQGATARQAVWDAGGVVIMPIDSRNYFVPSYRSVCPQGTSMLSDIENVTIAVDGLHQCYRTWMLTTAFKNSQEALIAKQNSILAELCKEERYSGIVKVKPNCYLDSYDVNNKFSTHIDLDIQGAVPARNATISVTTRLFEE